MTLNGMKEITMERNARQGLALARMVGHTTYISDAQMEKKFGRVQHDEEGIDRSLNFPVESH